jgi:hypothetical protein
MFIWIFSAKWLLDARNFCPKDIRINEHLVLTLTLHDLKVFKCLTVMMYMMIYNHQEATSSKRFTKIMSDLMIDTWEERSIWPLLFQPLLEKVIHQLLSAQYHVKQLPIESQDPMAAMRL